MTTKKMIFVLFFIMLFALPVFATEPYQYENDLDSLIRDFGADKLYSQTPDMAKEALDELGIGGIGVEDIANLTPVKLYDFIVNETGKRMAAPLRVCGIVFGIILLGAIAELFGTSSGKDSVKDIFSIISTICIGAAVSLPVYEFIKVVGGAIKACGDFMLTFIPILSAIILSSGQVVTAGAYQTIVFSAAQGVSALINTVVVPALTIYLVLSIISSLSDSIDVSGVIENIKKSAVWVLSLIATVFVSLLSIQGVIGGAADSVTARTMKFMLSSSIPAVGNALGEAYNSVYGGISLLKSAVGIYGILSVVVIILPIILEALLWMFALNISAGISEMFDIKNTTRMLRSSASVVSLMLAVILCSLMLLVVSTVIVLTIGGVK